MTNNRLAESFFGEVDPSDEMGTYEITLQIPMTLSQRFDYGSPSQWDWMTLIDLTEKITVKNCDLIESYDRIKEKENERVV